MSSKKAEPPQERAAIVGWLVQMNRQVGSWAAAMPWWRLMVLFLLLLLAGSMIGDQLNLKHDRVLELTKGEQTVTIGGPNGIRISQARRKANPESVTPAAEPASSAASASLEDTVAAAVRAGADAVEREMEQDEDLADKTVGREIFTFRGLLGDLGATALIILFAYLAAAKIVVRKVAESDARVRTAVSAAEGEAMERQLVQARLQVLQAQVEPHFLFNTLAAVDYLIETDPPRASQMQKALITYLRGALPQMREQSSTLGRELRLIRSYLELIKMRIEERLDVEFAVPEGLESAEFPPMMLQSLVENAIKHGIEPKPEGGKVTVSARVHNGQLCVEVKDTGIGIVDPDLLAGPTSGTGLGLQNIRERLSVLYPGKSRLSLFSDDSAGTTVTVGVPYKVSTAASAAESTAQLQQKPA